MPDNPKRVLAVFHHLRARPARELELPRKDTQGRLPKVYRQETITVPAAAFGKHQQGYRWGTKEWTKIYARRTAVEGVFEARWI